MTRAGLKWQVVLALAALTAVASSRESLADACEAVLKYQAFDINDQKIFHDLRLSSYDALCRTSWQSLQDYNNKTGNFDTSGKYLEIFAGGTHGDATLTTERFQEDFQRLCTQRDQRVLDRFFEFTHTQNTKNAVDAWSNCVKGKGLWSAIGLRK
jgi:hypothetical protein